MGLSSMESTSSSLTWSLQMTVNPGSHDLTVFDFIETMNKSNLRQYSLQSG